MPKNIIYVKSVLHGTDGATARAIVAHGKLLNRHTCPAAQFSGKKSAHPTCGVSNESNILLFTYIHTYFTSIVTSTHLFCL